MGGISISSNELFLKFLYHIAICSLIKSIIFLDMNVIKVRLDILDSSVLTL
jgi:hypothetical protein